MSTAPRVLLSALALAQPMGGVRRQAGQLFPRVAVLLEEAGGGLDILASRLGLPDELVSRLPASVRVIASPAAAGGPLARALSEPRAIAATLEAAKRRGQPYDLVHTGHMPVPKLDLPFTLMLHDLRDLEVGGASALRRAIAKRILPKTLARAAGILTVSNTMVRDLADRFPEVKDRIRLVPHGSDHLALIRRAPGPLEVPVQAPDPDLGPGEKGHAEPTKRGSFGFEETGDARAPILYLGHLEARKNIDLLLDTIARDPSLPPLLLVGLAKGNEDKRLMARARDLGIESRVRFQGPIAEADLPKLLATAGCMVLPSRIEGFGIPVLEAHHAGLPLAIARAGALPEAAAPDTPSFPTDQPEQCAKAIHQALNQSQDQLLAAQVFAAKFTWEKSARALAEAWTEAANPWIRPSRD